MQIDGADTMGVVRSYVVGKGGSGPDRIEGGGGNERGRGEGKIRYGEIDGNGAGNRRHGI